MLHEEAVVTPVTSQPLPTRARILLGATALVMFAGLCMVMSAARTAKLPLDLLVYRGSAEALLDGQGLYSFSIPDLAGAAGFLYPPFAALLVIPTLIVPVGFAAEAWTLIQYGLAGFLVWVVARGTRWSPPGMSMGKMLAAGGVWLLLITSLPVVSGIINGQVSLLITTLVMVDLVLLPEKWRGTLIGLAGAIKLTPMLIVIYFLTTRRWRAAILAVSTFAAAGILALIALPAESADYWTRIIFDSSRVPGFGSERNLSILGAFQFWGAQAAWAKPAWVVTATLVVVLAAVAAKRHSVRGEHAAAAIVIGLATAIAGPVAWDHYLVWLPLAGLYLALSGGRARRAAGWTLVVLSSALSPIWPADNTALWRDVTGALPFVGALAFCIFGLPMLQRTREGRDAVPAVQSGSA